MEQAGTGVPDPHRARRVDENSFLDLSERGGATTGLVHMPLSESVTDEAMPTLYAMPYCSADWPGEPDGGRRPTKSLPDATQVPHGWPVAAERRCSSHSSDCCRQRRRAKARRPRPQRDAPGGGRSRGRITS